MTQQEREEKWLKWPQGDAGDAIDFACGHAKEPMFFLEDWRAGQADEWPEYMRWLGVQRDGARAASADTLPEGQDAQQGLAGTESGAVPEGQTPGPSPSPAAGR